MKKLLIFSITAVLAAVIVLTGCKSNSEEKKVVVKEAELNPVSELAAYMREIHQQAVYIRQNLVDEKENLPFDYNSERLQAILTAEPTKGTSKDDLFEEYAKEFLEESHLFFISSKEQKTIYFNSMINSCVSCHQQYCPGPIKKIKKLHI
jgi:outer membrane murein-binding lipoprotein Lpp